MAFPPGYLPRRARWHRPPTTRGMPPLNGDIARCPVQSHNSECASPSPSPPWWHGVCPREVFMMDFSFTLNLHQPTSSWFLSEHQLASLHSIVSWDHLACSSTPSTKITRPSRPCLCNARDAGPLARQHVRIHWCIPRARTVMQGCGTHSTLRPSGIHPLGDVGGAVTRGGGEPARSPSDARRRPRSDARRLRRGGARAGQGCRTGVLRAMLRCSLGRR